MRKVLSLAFGLALLAACTERESPRPARDVAIAPAAHGPAPMVLRVPTGGGLPRVTAYPNTDSVLWTGDSAVPPVDRILSFDDNEGLVAFVDTRGRAGRLDLSSGAVTMVGGARLSGPASVGGGTIFGIDARGRVVRSTMSGEWSFEPPRPAREVFPLRDGAVLVLARGEGDSGILWRLRPPATTITDSLVVPRLGPSLATPVGDRIYFWSQGELLPIDARRFAVDRAVKEVGAATAFAITPSGDRIFAVDSLRPELLVIDRYRGRVLSRIALTARASGLRMDPLGRYLLIRDAAGDSLRVVAVDDLRIVRTLAGRWRRDLPLVAPDGAIAVARGRDVALIDPRTGDLQGIASGGAADFWFAFWWSGFRPVPAVSDDSFFLTRRDTVDSLVLPPVPDSMGVGTRDTSAARSFLIQFEWTPAEQRARDLAASIQVGDLAARVITTLEAGIPVHRVVIGPFPTRDEAERVAAASGRSYCIHDGVFCR